MIFSKRDIKISGDISLRVFLPVMGSIFVLSMLGVIAAIMSPWFQDRSDIYMLSIFSTHILIGFILLSNRIDKLQDSNEFDMKEYRSKARISVGINTTFVTLLTIVINIQLSMQATSMLLDILVGANFIIQIALLVALAKSCFNTINQIAGHHLGCKLLCLGCFVVPTWVLMIVS